MKAVRRKVAALCVLAVVAVAGVSLCFTARKGVESDGQEQDMDNGTTPQ